MSGLFKNKHKDTSSGSKDLRVILITGDNLEVFKDFLGKDMYTGLKKGLPYTAIGLLCGKTAIGTVAGYLDKGKVFTIMSLYVAPDWRRIGGGTMLIGKLRDILDKLDMPPAILSFVESGSETESIPPFLSSLGISEIQGLANIYRVPISSFYESDLFKDTYSNPDIKTISELSGPEMKMLFEQTDALISRFRGGGIDTFKPIRALSFVEFKNGKIAGYIFLGYTARHVDEPVMLISDDTDARTAAGLINSMVNACKKMCPPNMYLRIPSADDRYDRILERLVDVQKLQHNYIL